MSDTSADRLADARNIDLLLDIQLPVIVRFSSIEMTLQEILAISTGSIIELDKAVNEPVEIWINNKLLAHGEVVVVDGFYGVRITEIESRDARIRSLA